MCGVWQEGALAAELWPQGSVAAGDAPARTYTSLWPCGVPNGTAQEARRYLASKGNVPG